MVIKTRCPIRFPSSEHLLHLTLHGTKNKLFRRTAVARNHRYSISTLAMLMKKNVIVNISIQFSSLICSQNYKRSNRQKGLQSKRKKIIFSDQRHQYFHSGISLFLYFDEIWDLQQHLIRTTYHEISKLFILGDTQSTIRPKRPMPFCYICNVHLVVYRSECSDNIHSLCPQRNTCKAVSSPFSVKDGLSVTENKPYKIFTLKLLGHSISLSKTTRVCNIVIILHTVMVG